MEKKLLEKRDIMTSQSHKEAVQKQAANDLGNALHISPEGKKRLSLIDQMLQQAYQYNTLSKNEEVEILTQLEHMDLNKDWFSKGSEGSVFKIVIKGDDGKPKEYLVAKKRYDNNPVNEWHVHKRIQDVIQQSQIDTNVVTVPELKAVLNVDADNFIIMEFVKGKTLYQLQLQEILKKRGILVGDVETDVAIESMFFKALNLNQVNPEDCKKASNIYYRELKNIKLFSPEQGQKYKEALATFIKTIHKDGLYHRDGSNPRNIMIAEDGRLYVIDFGRSIDTKGTKMTEKQVYETQEGEHTGVYPKDEEILMEIDSLTKSTQDVEYENQQKEHKEKISTINEGASVITILKRLPEGRGKGAKKQEEILQQAKELSVKSKYIKLITIKEAKTDAQKLALLLAQSYENIPSLEKEIESEKILLTKEKQKEEEKQNHLPVYTLKGGAIAIEQYKKTCQKSIDAVNKKMDTILFIENKLSELKQLSNLKK